MSETNEKILELLRERTQIQRAIRDGAERIEAIEEQVLRLSEQPMTPSVAARANG